MSSLKMTFSLASLVLLMALVAMPVMAHDLITDEEGDQHEAGSLLSDHDDHPILDSVTVMGAAANGFVKSDTSFIVEFKFSGEAPTDFIASDIGSIGGVDPDNVVDFTTSADGLTFTARVTLTGDADITLSASQVQASW